MYGPEDEKALVERNKKKFPATDDVTGITEYPDDDLKNGEGIYYGDNYGYEYTHVDSGEPFTQDFLADNDDQIAHHMIHANSPYNDGWTRDFHKEELKKLKSERKQAVSYTHLRAHET